MTERTQGACTPTSLILVGGRGASPPVNSSKWYTPLQRVQVLSKGAASGEWGWSFLKPLPHNGTRWLGAAAVVDNRWLIVEGGTTAESGVAAGVAAVAANRERERRRDLVVTASGVGGTFPQRRGYILDLSKGNSTDWKAMALFPGGFRELPQMAGMNGTLFLFGGMRANLTRQAAYEEMTASTLGLGFVPTFTSQTVSF